MNNQRWRLASPTGLAACMALFGSSFLAIHSVQAAPAADLPIFVGKPLPSYQVTVADFERHKVLDGAAAIVPKAEPPKVSYGEIGARVSDRSAAGDALTLHWKDAWYSTLRIEGPPLDLRPYLATGVLAFDLKVEDLAKGGLSFQIDCGEGCERKVPFVLPGRALMGKGWQRVAFSMRCFAREGDDFSAVKKPFAVIGGGVGEVAVANVVIQPQGTPTAECPDYKTVSVTPDMLNESWSIDWWLPRHADKLAEIKRRKDIGLVFIGDSITQGWEKEGAPVWERHFKQYNALNLGYGGDRTENILWRLQHGEIDGIAPKAVVFMAGTNNTGHRHEDPRYIAAGIKRNLDELRKRLPDTKILLLAIFPREERADGMQRRNNEDVNAILAGYADNKHIFFRNINKSFLNADGVLAKDIMPDMLHPNEKGYDIWARAIEADVRALMQPSNRKRKKNHR